MLQTRASLWHASLIRLAVILVTRLLEWRYVICRSGAFNRFEGALPNPSFTGTDRAMLKEGEQPAYGEEQFARPGT